MKSPYRIRTDLQRVCLDGFAFPLGVESTPSRPLREGYCVTWLEGEGDNPDTYTFFVVLSHERLSPLLSDLFELLPDRVAGIMEVGSRDAFRAVDVFLGAAVIPVEQFLMGWSKYESIFLEDASLAVGVNTDEPFMEVFLDQDKRVTVHVEPDSRDQIESLLGRHGLEERDETDLAIPEEVLERTSVRPILVEDPWMICDVDQLLLALRYEWDLVLDEDCDRNLDSAGRNLGRTLWHTIILVERGEESTEDQGHAQAWAFASSRRELEGMVRTRLEEETDWSFREIYTLDRVAFDDRPESLVDMDPRHPRSEVLIFEVESTPGNDASKSRNPGGYDDG